MGFAQVFTPPVAVAPGGVVFDVTIAEALAIHPFTGFLTVSTYVPAVVTMMFCVMAVKPPGPVHEKVAPGVLVLPEIEIDGVEQFRVPEAVAEAVGGVVFDPTVTTADREQPFCGLVTLSV